MVGAYVDGVTGYWIADGRYSCEGKAHRAAAVGNSDTDDDARYSFAFAHCRAAAIGKTDDADDAETAGYDSAVMLARAKP